MAKQSIVKNSNKTCNTIFSDVITPNKLCQIKKHAITTTENKIVRGFNGRIPVHFEKEIDLEIDKLLKTGVIINTNSEWNSRLVPVRKNDGSLRLCVDYRSVNKLTHKEKYPLPLISEILDNLVNSVIFSTLDATSGYYQIAVEDKDTEKTAFTWKRNKYKFLRMPFGLCNAPLTFQQIMDKIFANEPDVLCYLDDIILKSTNR